MNEAFNVIWGKPENAKIAEIYNVLHKCKAMARRRKAELTNLSPTPSSIWGSFPDREVGDQLVQNYMRTMENTHRILHIPSFYREYEQYWKDPKRATLSSAFKILLIMAIGTCFYQDEGASSLRTQAQHWVYSAQAWATGPLEKGRLNLSELQVHCLLIFARQINSVGADLTWITAGSLLRTAFIMGLHRDPKFFPKMSIMQGEMYRRLWATILEITIQTSLNTGLPPLIAVDDFDTMPPLNINDEDLTDNTTVAPAPKPSHVFTQTSIQIQLLKSLPTRYKIIRQVNGIQSDASYDDVLGLGAEITTACNEATRCMNEYHPSPSQPTMLQRNLLDLSLRRFVLAVHWPFAVKSKEDPRFYFSRKVCLDAALLIASQESSSPNDPTPFLPHMDDYTRLKAVGGGFYREIIIYAAIIVGSELLKLLEEDKASGLPPSLTTTLSCAPLFKIMQGTVELMKTRVELGDNNIREYIFFYTVMARAKALENGADTELAVKDSALLSARHSLEMIKARASQPETLSYLGELLHADGNPGELPLSEQELPQDFMLQCENGPDGYTDTDMLDSWLFHDWTSSPLW
jgi:hypothetical protein